MGHCPYVANALGTKIRNPSHFTHLNRGSVSLWSSTHSKPSVNLIVVSMFKHLVEGYHTEEPAHSNVDEIIDQSRERVKRSRPRVWVEAIS